MPIPIINLLLHLSVSLSITYLSTYLSHVYLPIIYLYHTSIYLPIIYPSIYITCGVCFPGSALVKNSPANAGDTGDSGSIPGLGRSPRGGNGNPLQYYCLKNSMNRRAWQAPGVHGAYLCIYLYHIYILPIYLSPIYLPIIYLYHISLAIYYLSISSTGFVSLEN